MIALPDRQFFKIGEAAEIVGVKAHVLRYWESEFPSIKPLKTRGAHRMYRRSDVELLCVIHKLLHHEGYTIAGARKRVRELRASLRDGTSTPPAGNPPAAPGVTPQGMEALETPLPTPPLGVFEEPRGPREALLEASQVASSRDDVSPNVALVQEASRELALRAELIQLRRALSDLLGEIDQRRTAIPALTAQPSATVTAVVPKTILIPQRKLPR